MRSSALEKGDDKREIAKKQAASEKGWPFKEPPHPKMVSSSKRGEPAVKSEGTEMSGRRKACGEGKKHIKGGQLQRRKREVIVHRPQGKRRKKRKPPKETI